MYAKSILKKPLLRDRADNYFNYVKLPIPEGNQKIALYSFPEKDRNYKETGTRNIKRVLEQDFTRGNSRRTRSVLKSNDTSIIREMQLTGRTSVF